MKLAELPTLAEKTPIMLGTYLAGKPDQIDRPGKSTIYLERHFVMVDGEPKEFGRMLDKPTETTVGKFKSGDRVAVSLKLRPDKTDSRLFRVSSTLELITGDK